MSVKTFADFQKAREEYGPLHPVEAWEVAYTDPHQRNAVLVLTPDSQAAHGFPRRAYYFDRQGLTEMARGILRLLDPTTEDEILATLKRIESRLSERG